MYKDMYKYVSIRFGKLGRSVQMDVTTGSFMLHVGYIQSSLDHMF